jgi:hypothetical protein
MFTTAVHVATIRCTHIVVIAVYNSIVTTRQW